MSLIVRVFLVVFLACGAVFAELSKSEQKFYKKGQKIYEHMCNKDVLNATTIQQLHKQLDSHVCGNLSTKNKKALRFFYEKKNFEKQELTTRKQIDVPHGSKCPVCGMFVHKYPKWAAEVTFKNGEKKYFDGVKDMMKYIIFADEFGFDSEEIKSSRVTNYYTLEAIDATKAYYVIGSNLFGPMGHELIPFATEAEATTFLQQHFGKKIMKYNEVDGYHLNTLD